MSEKALTCAIRKRLGKNGKYLWKYEIGGECSNSLTQNEQHHYVALVYDLIEVRAVGRERTEEEKRRRHLYGDKGAKFSKGKQMCILGEISASLTTFINKDNLICEIYG